MANHEFATQKTSILLIVTDAESITLGILLQNYNFVCAMISRQ